MRILVQFGCRLGVALACAAAIAPLEAQPLPLVELRFPAYSHAIRADTLVHGWERIEASRVQTFAALQAVFSTLKIETDFLHPSRTALGALRLRPPRRLDENRLSTYLSCGSSRIGENADTQRLTIAIVTYLRDVSPTVTEIGTAMTGMSQDLSGAASDLSPCASLGVLEERIASQVREQLTSPARP